MKKLILIILLTIPTSAFAKHKHYEKFYQEAWCQGKGQTEVVLDDRTRVDCLTEIHAVEHDFARKWAEAIGQSLYYAVKTGKTPGIVLILEKKSEYKYLERINKVIKYYNLPIKVWVITNFD